MQNITKKYLISLSTLTALACAALYFFLNINLLLCYLASINIITLLTFAYDKHLAKNNHTRIPEFILLLASAIGATPAAILAMLIFRHKTKKKTFKTTLAIIIIAQTAIIITIKLLYHQG